MTDRPRAGERLVSLQTAAQTLGVTVRTVRRYIQRGDLVAYRVGPRALRVSHHQVRLLAHRLNGDATD